MKPESPNTALGKPLQSFPKTLIVDLSNGYGGATSRVLSLLMNSPRDRIAVAGLESGAVVQLALKRGHCVYPVGKHKLDLRILPKLVRVIRDEGFEVIDSQNVQSKFWAWLAALWIQFAFVSTIHSWYAKEHGQASLKGKLYTTLELVTNRRLDLYISVSQKDRQALQNAGFKDEKVEMIYNAVSIDPDKVTGEGNWLKKKFNLLSEAVVCTAVGRLVPVKGYDVLIAAFKEIAATVPNLVIVIVGEGEEQNELQHQIDRSGLQDRVRLVGYYDRDTVLSIVKSSDIFAMPSRYEGTPIALLEAAALARPILSTTAGGIPELVMHGESALLVPPGDPHALGAALARLASDKEYAEGLGSNAQKRIQSYFNLNKQVEETWNAYRKAWSRHYASH